MTLLTILACAVIAAPLIHFAPHLEGDARHKIDKIEDKEAQGFKAARIVLCKEKPARERVFLFSVIIR